MASMSTEAKGSSIVGDDIPGASAMIGQLREEVQCPICLMRLTRPRVLSCLHSFCERCLLKLRRPPRFEDVDDEDDEDDFYGDVIRCPVCRDITDLPSGTISDLKIDFRANKVGEILDQLDSRKRKFSDSSVYRCEICAVSEGTSNVPAVDYCQDCGKLFCDQCSKVHRRLPGTDDHHVVSVEGLMAGSAKLRKTQHESDAFKTCSEHSGERNKYFCKSCIRPVCTLCTSFGPCTCHQEDVITFSNATLEMSGVVQMLTDRLRHQLSRVEGILEKSNKAILNAEVIKKSSIVKLQSRHSELIRLLAVKFQRAVSDRETSFGSKINDLRGVTEKAQKMRIMSEKAIGLACDVTKDSIPQNGADLATSFGCLQSVLSSITPDQLESLERDVSSMEQEVSSIPDVKMKGVRLEWNPNEQLTVEPILLDGNARGHPINPPTNTNTAPHAPGAGNSNFYNRGPAAVQQPTFPMASLRQPLVGVPPVPAATIGPAMRRTSLPARPRMTPFY